MPRVSTERYPQQSLASQASAPAQLFVQTAMLTVPVECLQTHETPLTELTVTEIDGAQAIT
jgi:hypothetical protein